MSLPYWSVGDYYFVYKLIGGSLVTSRVTRNTVSCESGKCRCWVTYYIYTAKETLQRLTLIFPLKCVQCVYMLSCNPIYLCKRIHQFYSLHQLCLPFSTRWIMCREGPIVQASVELGKRQGHCWSRERRSYVEHSLSVWYTPRPTSIGLLDLLALP